MDEDEEEEECANCSGVLQQCISCFVLFCPYCTSGGDECLGCNDRQWRQILSAGDDLPTLEDLGEEEVETD